MCNDGRAEDTKPPTTRGGDEAEARRKAPANIVTHTHETNEQATPNQAFDARRMRDDTMSPFAAKHRQCMRTHHTHTLHT